MTGNLRGLIKIAKKLSQRPDLVQGAGGNLSIKLDGKRMLIKASGLEFSELSEKKGFVAVDYAKLRRRYGRDKVFNEKKEAEFLLGCVMKKGSRPSMEAGFHAFLGKYVLHTHSVYANVLSCAKGGKKIALGICGHIGIDVTFIGYSNPGPDLAVAIGKLANRNTLPAVIFLENHGLVISGDTADKVLDLHEKVNEGIKRALRLEKYPRVGIKAFGGGFKSKYLRGLNGATFKKTVLFPDQAVFCVDENKKIVVNGKGEVFFNTNKREALVIEEIMNAWSYILCSIKRLKLSPLTLNRSVVRYLTNMEAEKHRKMILR